MFQGGDELAGFEQAVVRAGVQPGKAPRHDLHTQLAQIQVGLVNGSDFELAARAGLDRFGNIHYLRVIKIQAGDGVVALRLDRLFFNAASLACGVEGDHAIALGVLHMVGKDCGATGLRVGTGEQRGEVMAVKNVVAQHQGARGTIQKIFSNQKRLSQTVGAGLYGVLQMDTPLAAVTQQLFKARQVLRRADDENVTHAAQHERAQRVVNHGLVIHRQKLLAHGQCGRVQPRAGAAGEDDAFAWSHEFYLPGVEVRTWASMPSTPCCQSGNLMLKAACSLRVSRRELCGRRAAVAKTLDGTLAISFTAQDKSGRNALAWRMTWLA